jgi:polyketide biosynthesis enoyl-CoA hydratase PksH
VDFKSIILDKQARHFVITLNRAAEYNTITNALLTELISVINLAENTENCAAVVIQGSGGIFCTGMDFKNIVSQMNESNFLDFADSPLYSDTLKRFASCSVAVIAKLDGVVKAGGVGLAAACDLVISNEKTSFCLSEALWGLLPAQVMPYLIRRTGFQTAYRMTLTTETIDAKKAYEWKLIDILSENPDAEIKKLITKIQRVKSETILELKDYFRKMWLIDEAMEELAKEELKKLISKKTTQASIKNFIENGKLPWEN